MKNKISSYLLSAGLLLGISVLMFNCKKDKIVEADKQVAFFAATGVGTYSVTSPTVVYKVPVGLTKASSVDRTVGVTVTSPTGAAQGAQYSLSTTSLTFEAGTVVDTIVVTAVYAQYQAGRKDTLNFAFTNASDVAPSLNPTYKLYLRGPCFEGDFVANAFQGSYPQTNELFGTSAYGPYTITISAVTLLTPTTGKVSVTNIWDSGWNPLEFILDWTNPNNRTVLPVSVSSGVGDAGTISATYAGQQVAVRPFAGQAGTFSFCNKTINFKMQLGVAGLGWFGSLYTVTPGR